MSEFMAGLGTFIMWTSGIGFVIVGILYVIAWACNQKHK